MDQTQTQTYPRPPRDLRPKTQDVTHTKGTSFEDFNLKEDLLRGIYEYDYQEPSPVQEATIPSALMRRDILARAKNGTGKTASFLIPTLETIDTSLKAIQSVILVPTRELALQTADVAKRLGQFLPNLQVMVATGGPSIKEDIIRISQKPHIVVATPGRLCELVRQRNADLSKCNILVLDEADKLLTDIFYRQITSVMNQMPQGRQLLLFSATFPASVREFKTKFMKPDTHMVNLMSELTLKGVTQYYAYVEERQKVHCLYTLFKKLDINQSIIFCNSVNRVKHLAMKITELGFSCYYIHSQMDQSERNQVFQNFRNGHCRNLVCSDVWARGIDIQSVNVVFNFDMPKTSETYLHRIGRSGRFGHYGLSISFVTPSDREALYKIETELGCQVEPIPENVDPSLYAFTGQVEEIEEDFE
ncbi:hypothetical protein RCL1_008465 [Eukaryota sp. TZLM3-RCL]